VVQRIVGYTLLLVGVLFGFVGLIALRSRSDGGATPAWGWPETVALVVGIAAVCAGLVVLTIRPRNK
jgi:hypothetical protein